MELHAKIEALLFFKGEPVSLKKIGEILDADQEQVEEALRILAENKQGTGLAVVLTDNEATLGTAKEASELLESLRKDELTKELSKAALETLSIILYKQGISRSEIDYIRGVNSSFILRNLLIRGLIEKMQDANDTRKFIYMPTIDTLRFMGVTNVSELPRYADVVEELQKALSGEVPEEGSLMAADKKAEDLSVEEEPEIHE